VTLLFCLNNECNPPLMYIPTGPGWLLLLELKVMPR
jgi:hypothetical protein